MLGKSNGQRNLVDYSPCGNKRVGHDLATKPNKIYNKNMYYIAIHMHIYIHTHLYIYVYMVYISMLHILLYVGI